jgi:hypothetical protein
VEHQCAGFQRFVEFFLAERNCLAVVVRTSDFEINAVVHEPPEDSGNPLLRLPEPFLSTLMVARAASERPYCDQVNLPDGRSRPYA